MATCVMVVLSVFAALYLSKAIIVFLWRTIVAYRMSGWIRIWFDNIIYVKMAVLLLAGFGVVAVLEMRKIRRIPMTDALKNVE